MAYDNVYTLEQIRQELNVYISQNNSENLYKSIVAEFAFFDKDEVIKIKKDWLKKQEEFTIFDDEDVGGCSIGQVAQKC